jgi:hypothetical protein
MLLNVSPDELVALKAAMDIALKAASGYSVRTCPSRDTIGTLWKEFTRLHGRIKALDGQREFHMSHAAAKGRKYVHVAMSDDVHDRLHQYLLHLGGGKVRAGALGELIDKAVNEYLHAHPVVVWPGHTERVEGHYPEHDADAA